MSLLHKKLIICFNGMMGLKSKIFQILTVNQKIGHDRLISGFQGSGSGFKLYMDPDPGQPPDPGAKKRVQKGLE